MRFEVTLAFTTTASVASFDAAKIGEIQARAYSPCAQEPASCKSQPTGCGYQRLLARDCCRPASPKPRVCRRPRSMSACVRRPQRAASPTIQKERFVPRTTGPAGFKQVAQEPRSSQRSPRSTLRAVKRLRRR